MSLSARYLLRTMAALSLVFAVAVAAWAETCTLELKRLDANSSGTDYTYRACYPQHFFVQIVNNAPQQDPRMQETFKRIVKKEPSYECQKPFRGVAKFGSREYAFALDAVPTAAEKEKAEKEKAEREKKDKKADEKGKTDSATGKLADKVDKANKAKADEQPKVISYNRLYFDLNHNGDLTDDKPVEADNRGVPQVYGGQNQSYAFFRFPRVDIKLDVDGTEADYSFFVQGQARSSRDFSYCQVSLNAAAYREGDVTLDGKKHRIALIDFNSNGRFGDEMKVVSVMSSRGGGKVVSENRPQPGDMLLVDPGPNMGSPYDVTSSDSRNYVSSIVAIDGRFYDMKISPAGDKLTLNPSQLALGKLTNPSDGKFRALIYGDNGCLKIRGDKDTPAVVPVGDWKLLSYTIEFTEPEKPKADEKKAEGASDKAAEKKADKKADSEKKKEQLTKRLRAAMANNARHSLVSAEMNGPYKAVKVVKDETAALPFGPPYKPAVTGDYYQDGGERKVLGLSLAIVGSAGENCENMVVNGSRPSKPKLTITDDKGKVVEEGNFEYG
jgi:hypothetical protein